MLGGARCLLSMPNAHLGKGRTQRHIHIHIHQPSSSSSSTEEKMKGSEFCMVLHTTLALSHDTTMCGLQLYRTLSLGPPLNAAQTTATPWSNAARATATPWSNAARTTATSCQTQPKPRLHLGQTQPEPQLHLVKRSPNHSYIRTPNPERRTKHKTTASRSRMRACAVRAHRQGNTQYTAGSKANGRPLTSIDQQ